MPASRETGTFRRRWRSPAALACCITLLSGYMGWLQPIEDRLIDARAALTRHLVAGDIALIEIDEHSLKRLDTWPWPRRYHARLLDVLRDAGVKDVFYDVDFSSRSNPEDDRLLARAVAGFPPGRIMLPTFLQARHTLDMGSLVVSRPLAALREPSIPVSVNVRPDSDGLVRSITAAWHLKDLNLVSPGMRMAGLTQYPGGTIRIDYGISPQSIPSFSFADVLSGNVDTAALRGKHVIVGATAIELGDRLPVPVYHSLPGPVVQALSYLTIREGGLRGLPPALAAALSVALALFMGVVFRRATWYGVLAALTAATGALLGLAVYIYRAWHIAAPAAPLLLQTGLGYGFFLVARLHQQHLHLLLQAIDIRRKDALMSSVVNHSIDAILTVSHRGRIQSANPAAETLFGLPEHRLTAMSIDALIVDLPLTAGRGDILGQVLATAGTTSAHQARRPDGRTFPVELAISAIGHERGSVLYTLFIRDVTERVQQHERLQFQATHDALTGLANRYLLTGTLERMLAPGQAAPDRIALLICDLDRFKDINDSLGHLTGDEVLVQIAARFRDAAGDAEILARLGGDEFAVLVHEAPDGEAGRHTAQRLLQSLQAPFRIDGLSLEVGASIGIAHWPDHAPDAVTLLQHADTAMYVAKREGTGTACYRAEFTQINVLRMNISTGLRQAMNGGQLAMYYQPKVDLPTGAVTGFEALLRWRHPELGFIPPDEIVGVAENTGLIWPLTEWTIEQVAHDAAAWRGAGTGARVAVNLSAKLLQDAELMEQLQRWLDAAGGGTQWLALEITETAIMRHPERALANAQALSERGIQLSIDDFGTGYSSLSYLRNLPASELKIDKSFVMDMLTEPNDMRIVKSTIDLAHNLGLKVVAEGVETEDVLDALRGLGCDAAQGYFFSPPAPFDKISAWMQQRRRSARRQPSADPA